MLLSYSFVFLLNCIMSENTKEQAFESFLHWEDWVVLLTGGMITTGAIGWIVYRSLESQKLDYKAIKTIATSFVGGMGIYFTSSAIVFMFRKSSDSPRKSITSKDESNFPVLDCETSPYKRIVDVINGMDREFASEASKAMDLDKKIYRNIIQEAAEAPCKSEDMLKRLNAFNRQGPRNGLLKLSTDNQMETCYKEGIGIRKAKFRDEIISYISELKGYVQGTIDPLPLARNIQLRSSEASDEIRRQMVVIVKEYANNMLPKLEQVIDDFMDSVYKPGKVHNDREYKVKKALETLGVPEKNQSKVPQKIDMNQYNDAMENGTKSRSQICHNWQRSKNAFELKIRSPESASSSSLNEKNAWMKISELPSPVVPRLATPFSEGVSFMSQGVNKLDHRAVEKLKIQRSNPPVKLTLNEEQKKFLNILKSEL